MNHKGTVRLQTGRLILRRLTAEDDEAMFRNWASDPEVTKYLTWPPHKNIDVTRTLLGRWISEYDSDDYYQWGIELKELGEVIGGISVVNMNESTEMIHVGYCLGAAWWHKGIMTEAFRAVIHFLFTEVGCNRIESQYDVNNPNSGAVMKKCGLSFEGIMRSAGRNNQGICDLGQYAILKSDYLTLTQA